MERRCKGPSKALRPLQRVRIVIGTERPLLGLNAAVAWAEFELPRAKDTGVYRVDVEFMNADPKAVDAFRKQYEQG